MKLPHLVTITCLSLLFPACKHSGADSKGRPTSFKITDYEIVSLPGKLNLVVSGGGATPNSQVAVSLRYQLGGDVARSLGTVTADNQGAFKISSTQACLSITPAGPRFEATDVFTGILSNPTSFDPELLKCDY